MKKRFLSAALALAMALTLLPMSVFATIAAPGSDDAKAKENAPASGYTTVQYVYGTDYSKPKAVTTGSPAQYVSDAWAWQWTDTAGTYGTPNKTYWASSTTLGGVVNGTAANGTWYADMTDLTQTATNGTQTLRTSSFTLLEDFSLTSVYTSTSLSVNLFGSELTLPNDLKTVNSITLTDTFHTTYGGAAGTVSDITRNVGSYTTGTPATTMSASGMTVTATGVKMGSITLTGRANTVTLTDVELTGNIGMTGTTTVTATNGTTTTTYPGQRLTINAKNTVPYTKSVVSGSITVVGNGSALTLNGVTGTSGAATGAISVTSTGGSVTTANGAYLGAITVNSGLDRTATSAPPSVTVNDSVVNGYTYTAPAGNTALGTLTVNAQGRMTGDITTDSGTVSLNSANVAGVTVKSGTLNVSGANGASTGITLGDGAKATKVTFNFTATNYKGGTITKASNDTALTIGNNWPTGRGNTFGTVDLKNYTGQGIKGGIFTTPADTTAKAAWFSADLQFMRKDGSNYAYYGKKELAAAIADAKDAAKTEGTLMVIGWKGTNDSATAKYAEFYNSMLDVTTNTAAVAKLGYSMSTAIYLPDMINGTAVATWTDASTVNTPTTGTAKTYGVNELVSLSSQSTGVKLVIQSNGAAVSRLTNVTVAGSAPNNSVTVTLSGNQINLSGAVGQSAFEDVKVTCTTDLIGTDGQPVTFDVVVSFDTTTKVATISTLGISPPPLGVTINTSNNTIVVGSNTYTLSVGGLTKPASNLLVAGITGTYAYQGSDITGTGIVTTVTASGLQNSSKQTLIDAINCDDGFVWANSPAMQQLVNQAMTTITTNNTLDNYVTAAQRAAWNLNNKGKTPSSDDLYATGYTTAVVEPYLAVTVTAYNQNGTLTLNLVPSYRVLVVSNNNTYIGDGAGEGIAKNKTNFTADGYYIAKGASSLGTPITDLTKADGTGGVTITIPDAGVTAMGISAKTVMHQDSTYAYVTDTAGKYTLTRGGKTGLGTVVLNTIAPLVELDRAEDATNFSNGAANATYYYDNLQAAVDDTLPQATEALQDTITVTSAYTGSGTIDVTGTARVFKIETEGMTKITNANNNFTVGTDSTGHKFTVQLQQSVAAVTGQVEVAVATALNGYGVPSVSSAKAGDQVVVTLAPNTGYQGSVTAKTNTGATVTLTSLGNNQYSFVVPDGATRVEVTPVFLSSSQLPFTDVSTSDSFYNAVKWNFENLLIMGNTATTFNPYGYLVRGQVVLILYRHAGSPAVNTTSYPYTDMPTYDAEMCRAIIWATNNKIVEGYGDGRFGASNTVRNQELAKILYQYNVYRGKSVSGSVSLSSYFTDASKISSWAVPYVQWAVANSVMGPVTGREFQPQLQLRRWQVAVDMYNYGMKYGI